MKGQQFARMGTIAKILTEEGFGYVLERLGWTGKIDEKVQEEAAQAPVDEANAPARLRRVLERLGPLFVKFGQILSTRQDLLPTEYCEAFARSASLSEFVAGQLLGQHTDQPKSRPKGSFGADLTAVVLWLLGGYFLAQQPGTVSTIGELSLPSALFLGLALFATMAAWQKRWYLLAVSC